MQCPPVPQSVSLRCGQYGLHNGCDSPCARGFPWTAQRRLDDHSSHCVAPWRHWHFGDGENSLLMLNADATAEQILAQAVMGITDVQVRAV